MNLRKLFDKRFSKVDRLYSKLYNAYEQEELHQYRVNLRRLYAYNDIFIKNIDPESYKKFEKVLHRLLKPTSGFRDIDLFVEQIDTLECAVPLRQKLYEIFDVQRKQAFLDYTQAFCSKKYKKRLKRLQQLIEEEVVLKRHDDLEKIVEESANALYGRFLRLSSNASLSKFHKLRIEFKKFRYAYEAYEKHGRYMVNLPFNRAKLMLLQDLFGGIQDNHARLRFIHESQTLTPQERMDLQAIFLENIRNLKIELFKLK
jgi:CHAD domain-containing protein